MRSSSPISLIAVDLDGTLLDDQKRIGPRSLAALQDAVKGGVKVVLATARPPRSTKAFVKQLALDTLQVNYNGALIWDTSAACAIQHFPMDPVLVGTIIQHARRRYPDCLVGCEILDRWCTDRHDCTYTTETGKLFPPDVIAPFGEFLLQPITKLMLQGPPPEMMHLQADIAAAFDSVAVLRSDPDLIQIMAGGASKASGVAYVARSYDVPMSEVLAIGDATNDIELLCQSGHTVAVSNACDAVKAVCQWVGPSNNEDGVWAALHRFGLA